MNDEAEEQKAGGGSLEYWQSVSRRSLPDSVLYYDDTVSKALIYADRLSTAVEHHSPLTVEDLALIGLEFQLALYDRRHESDEGQQSYRAWQEFVSHRLGNPESEQPLDWNGTPMRLVLRYEPVSPESEESPPTHGAGTPAPIRPKPSTLSGTDAKDMPTEDTNDRQV